MTEARLIRDEIHTENAEYAAMLERSHREHGLVPYNGYMWRVTQVDRIDYSQTVEVGGLFDWSPPPGVYHIPGPTTFVFLLERDA